MLRMLDIQVNIFTTAVMIPSIDYRLYVVYYHYPYRRNAVKNRVHLNHEPPTAALEVDTLYALRDTTSVHSTLYAIRKGPYVRRTLNAIIRLLFTAGPPETTFSIGLMNVSVEQPPTTVSCCSVY